MSTALAGLLDGAPEAFVAFDPAGNVTFGNRAAMRLLSVEPGQGAEHLAAGLDAAGRSWLLACLRAPRAAAETRAAALRDGRPVLLQCWPLERGRGLRVVPQGAAAEPPPPAAPSEPAGLPGLSEASEELLRMVWASPFPAALQDAKFRMVDVNDAYVEFTGYPREHLIGLDPLQLEPGEERSGRRDERLAVREAVSGGRTMPMLERRLLDAHGRERWFRVTGYPIQRGDEAPHLLAVLQDCTAEHVARAQADRSLEELAHWFDLSPTGMLVFDAAGLVVRSNAAFEALVGRVPVLLEDASAELQALLAWRGSRPDPALEPGAPALERQAVVPLPDGTRRRLSARLSAFATPAGQRRYMGVVEDRSAEEERDRAQHEIETLMDTASVGVATYDPARGWLAQPGGRGGVAAGSLQTIGREWVDPASLPAYERLQTALRHGERCEVRYAIRHPELGLRWLLTRVEPGERAGGGTLASVVTLDVTERERAQRRNEQLLRELTTILDGSTAGIAYLRGALLVRCNERFERMLGLRPGTAAGSSLEALMGHQPAALQAVLQARAALAAGPSYEAEFPLSWADEGRAAAARPAWCSLSIRRAPAAPGAEGAAAGEDAGELVAVLTDISRLKSQQAEVERARESLALQAERTRAVLDSVLVGIVTVDDGGIEWMNRSARRMFGGDLADFVGQPMSVVATDEPGHPLRRNDYLETLQEGEAESFECQLRARDGRTFWVVGNAVRTGVDGWRQEAPRLTFALLDIERRRQAEVSIAQAQASLQRVIETAPLALALFDSRSLEPLQANQTASLLLGTGPGTAGDAAPRAALGQEVGELLAAQRGRAEVGQRLLRQALPDGGARIWDARIVTLATGETGGEQLLLVASDVTEQRAADEARLQSAIAQRERLVKEVHHRIKNNLQGVAGLLQQAARRQPQVAPVLEEAVSQVQAIAQVYGLQLGDGGLLGLVSVVEAIAGSVQRSLGREITVQLQGTPALGEVLRSWQLPENESIPIALALNELFTNAVRHGAPGEVSCRVRTDDESGALGVELVVRNPGRLPEGFSLARFPGGVSGLNLVRSLLPRRSAHLAMEEAEGHVLARMRLMPPSVRLAPSPRTVGAGGARVASE